MQKIETLFKRDDRFRAIDEVNEGCEWVTSGEGIATEKWDGSACAVIDGKLYKRHRHDASKGDPPPGWRHWSHDPEAVSGHGWLLCVEGDPSCRYHFEALDAHDRLPDGTYELVGPKSNGNPHGLSAHRLKQHGTPSEKYHGELPPRDFYGLRKWLEEHETEGIVWHHEDGRMVKIKRRDFGIPWPVKGAR